MKKNYYMKKLIVKLLLTATIVCSLAACSATTSDKNDDTSKKMTITALNGNSEETKVTVPYDPQRIAVLDFAALDIIDNLGLGDRVVGTADTSIEYLKSYVDNKNIANLGTIKEADLESVMASNPDVIFIGGRLAGSYDALTEIAPVVYLKNDYEIGIVNSITKNATTIASMFGLENEVENKMSAFTERITALKQVSEGKTALVGLITSGSLNLMANNSRCSIVGDEVGFQNLISESEEKSSDSSSGSTHGNEASFETVVSKAPDYIFVLDRDSAIGTEGAKLAKEVMENELVKGTAAYKNGNIIYLENSSIWYTAEGGITALDIMIKDLENELLK